MSDESFRAKWGSDEELDRDYLEKQHISQQCDDAEREQEAQLQAAADRSRELTRELVNIARHHYLLARIEATGTD